MDHDQHSTRPNLCQSGLVRQLALISRDVQPLFSGLIRLLLNTDSHGRNPLRPLADFECDCTPRTAHAICVPA